MDGLTHVQLSYETRHVIMLIVEWQQFFCKLCLILYDEASSILE